jgi:hypothetical protein
MRLKAELEALGFRASETDPALIVKGARRQATYVLVWVDHILVAGLERKEIAAVKDLLGAVLGHIRAFEAFADPKSSKSAPLQLS